MTWTNRLLCMAACLLALLSPALGDPVFSLLQLWQFSLPSAPPSLEALILQELRWPRTLVAVLGGAALGCAGCLLQRLTANQLASPGLIGINQGAALGLVLLIMSPLPLSPLLSFSAAFTGALLAMVLVFMLTRLSFGFLSPEGLLLCGALLGSLYGALTLALLLINQHALEQIRFWLAGSLSYVEPSQLGPMAILVISGLLFAFALQRRLQVLELGSDAAHGLGINPLHALIQIMLVILVLTAAAVAVIGPILFLGLIVPHLSRSLWGDQLWRQLSGSAVLGALLLLAADSFIRLTPQADQLPPSVPLAVLGVPCFIWLIMRRYARES